MSADPATKATREATIRRARSWILEGRRVDMGALAADVGIGRATIHRWFGTREQLIGDTIWALVERTIDEVALEADGRGADRLSFIVSTIVERFSGSPAISAFVAAEPRALALIVDPERRLLERFAARVQRLVEVEVRLGALPADLDAAAASALIARVATAMAFTDLVAEQPPDPAPVDQVVRAILR